MPASLDLGRLHDRAKWPAYAPFIDDMLASLEPDLSNEPY
jgi:hypothetical protein